MLKTPPYLIAAALALWAWRSGWWIPAVVLAALCEGSRVVKMRWEFTDKKYSRIFDVCTVLFGGAVVYLRSSEDLTRSGFVLFQWGPVIFALMLLAQAYGTREKVPYQVFSWFLRFRKDKSGAREGGLNISWCYFGVCLLGAGATNERDPYFYLAVIALCAWAGWATRVRRYSTAIWASCCIAAAVAGWAGQKGWVGFQNLMTPFLGKVFARFGATEFDDHQARTTMGEIGSKKTSGKIVLRVKAEIGRPPRLLRQASYDNMKDQIWTATRREWTEARPENDVTSWILQAEQTNLAAVRVSGYLRGRKGLLSLPHGVSRIRDLPVGKLETTLLGVARAQDGPGVIKYLAEFGGSKTTDAETSDQDLLAPEIERVSAIAEIAAEVRMNARTTNEADLVRAVEDFFTKNFSYSLYRARSAPASGTVLSEFLKNQRAGHCEYFASATTLLLRELKIPARYAVGYSVQESKGDTFIVRERHGHAWVLAWLNGAWREVDTTPGSWFALESDQASKMEMVNDFFSNLWFRFSEWRWLGEKGLISRTAPYLVIPLVGILIWRIFFRKKLVEQKRSARRQFSWPGLDSEYYELEARLAAAGHERHPHETPAQWIARLGRHGIGHPSLPALLDLHYRHRFDPRGLQTAERVALRSLSRTEIQAGSPPKSDR